MDAIVLRGNNDVGVESIPDPTPLASEVVIEVAATGLCGTDLHEYVSGPTFSQPPVVLGHEISGRIVEVGSGVDRSRIGEGVTVIPMDFCGSCHYCHRALYHLCLRPEWIGLTRDGAWRPTRRCRLASRSGCRTRWTLRRPHSPNPPQ